MARIRGAIIDELRSLDWVPRSVRTRARQIERAIGRSRGSSCARRPTRRSPRSSGVTERGARGRACARSRAPRSRRSTSCGRLRRRRPDRAHRHDRGRVGPDPEVSLEQTEIKEALAEAISSLPEREKLVVTLYYYEELTLREIGEVLGVTESRVSQLHTKAILRLKAHLAGRDAANLLEQLAARMPSLRRESKLCGRTQHEGGGPPMPRARKDPQRRRRRPPRDGKDVARRGAPLPVGRDQPARHGRGRARRTRTRTRTSTSGSSRSRVARAHRVAGPEGQPHRRPGRSELPGRAAQRRAGRRGRARDGVGGDGSRGRDIACLEARRRARARARRVREHARPRARRLLPHARAAPGAALDTCVAVHIPIGHEHELTGIVDVLHMCAYTSPEGAKEGEPGPIPDEMAGLAAEYREKLLDAVVETDEGLMERYLEGEELGAEEVAAALKAAVTSGDVFPVACGVATKNLGTHALLDLLVEGVPSPAKKGSPIDVDGRRHGGVRLQDRGRPVRRAHQRVPRAQGHRHRRLDARQPPREGRRSGWVASRAPGQGAPSRLGVRRGRHRRGREAQGGADGRSPRDKEVEVEMPEFGVPGAGDELRDHAEVEGRRGEGRDRDPPARRGGSDAAAPARPADGRGDPLRA